MKPVRIQRKRTKGFSLQQASPNGLPVVYVGRPTVYGNPFATVEEFQHWWETRGKGFVLFADRMDMLMGAMFQTDPHPLRGKNLACWCPLDRACHADVLLEIAAGALLDGREWREMPA